MRGKEHVRLRAPRLGEALERVAERLGERLDESGLGSPVRRGKERRRRCPLARQLFGDALHLSRVHVRAVRGEGNDAERSPIARQGGEHVFRERVPEAHGQVDASAGPGALDAARELARNREQG